MLFSGAPNRNLWQALSENENLRASFAVFWFWPGFFPHTFFSQDIPLGPSCLLLIKDIEVFFNEFLKSFVFVKAKASHAADCCAVAIIMLLLNEYSFKKYAWYLYVAALSDDAAVTQF